jgi:hypothetical protein
LSGVTIIKLSLLSKLLNIGLLVLSVSCAVQADSTKDQAALTAATLNVVRLTRWPVAGTHHSATTFDLCVIGNNMVQQSFVQMSPKVVNHKTIRILQRSYLQDLSECHLVYMSGLKRVALMQALLSLKNKPVLTIGEGVEFIQVGGMVGLVLIQDAIQLHINSLILDQASLVVSSRLLKLGKIYNFSYP